MVAARPPTRSIRPEEHEPEWPLVGVEEVGDVRVVGPRPPHRGEQSDERDGAVERGVGMQSRGELRHRDDEDQVEEQLGPGRVAFDPLLAGLLQPQQCPSLDVVPLRRRTGAG